MIEKPAGTQQDTGSQAAPPRRRMATLSLVWPIVCATGYVLCILFSVTPLTRIPDTVIHLHTPLGALLASPGAWLPTDLGLTNNSQASKTGSAYVIFLGLMALAFAFYGLYAWFVARQPAQSNFHSQARGLIWPVVALAGLIYVFTPAMLSHDILVYASYSRLLAVYHANPYFVPLAAFPQDPYTPMNYWAGSLAAYGPLWLAVCGIIGSIAGPQPISYVLAFRLLALAAHLMNTWLVGRTLHAMGRSPRTVMLGMALYALNPLVLLESSLGGHNDVFMMSFILASMLMAARAEQRGYLLSPGGYLPPLIAFTLAALVKFTILPVVALYIIMLAWKTRQATWSPAKPLHFTSANSWKQALLVSALAAGVVVLLALAFYGPFWIGHSLSAIHASFSSPPSAQFAENSILRAIGQWSSDNLTAGQRAGNIAVRILSARSTWDNINYAILGLACILGAIALWRSPTLNTLLLASLAALGALLIITPWFYSWYITWIVGLAALVVALRHTRAGRALLAFSLAFSASALLTYLYLPGIPPFGLWSGLVFLVTIAPPITVMLVAIMAWRPSCAKE